jgi:hypothetical protein
MPRTVSQGFEVFLNRLAPTATERDAAAMHRTSVYKALDDHLDVVAKWETGSFTHGTAISGHTDVDVLISLRGSKPQLSDTALSKVRNALSKRFVLTPVVVRRPAVVVKFGRGQEWELVPAYIKSTAGEHFTYDIPAPGGNWMTTAPTAHAAYVNNSNKNGGAKRLARLMKAWKYYNNVPVSSFYLEMRAAQRMHADPGFVPLVDLTYLLLSLQQSGLADMNDPSGRAGRISACSSVAKRDEALSKLATAATRCDKALTAELDERPADAFLWLNLLFNGHFPSR